MRSDNHFSILEYAYLELADAVCRGEADGKVVERHILKEVRRANDREQNASAFPEPTPA